MSRLAPVIEGFFTARLTQRRATPATVATYRDTFRLLLDFAQRRTGRPPSQLDVTDIEPNWSAPSWSTSRWYGPTASGPGTCA